MISIIVATHSRERLLVRTLEALVAQDWPRDDFEIVVVDNASTDGTAAVVRALSQRLQNAPRVILVHEATPGKTHAVNAGLAAAHGDLFAFTDDDVIPEPQWLRALSTAMTETGADFAVGRISPLWETAPPDWVSPALHGVLAIPDNGPARLDVRSGLNEHVMALAGNLAVQPRVFAEIGPWRTDLGKELGSLRSGEDHEFFLRMIRSGHRGVYEPSARVAHLVPTARLNRVYFRRWLYENGQMVAGLERQFPSTTHHLLRIPRYLWRQAAGDAVKLVRACRPGHGRDRFAAETRLWWFAGFVRSTWGRRVSPPAASQAVLTG